MSKITHSICLSVTMFALAFSLTGCGNTTSKSDAPAAPGDEYTYTVSFIKSKDNGTGFKHKTNDKNLELGTLISNLNLDNPELDIKFDTVFDTNSGENVIDATKILGVINTASKKWQLYLNGSRVKYYTVKNLVVTPENIIEWKYE